MDNGIFHLNASQEHWLADPDRWSAWMKSEDCGREGRTMALAHHVIREVWAKPGIWYLVKDHYPTLDAHRYLLNVLRHLCLASDIGKFMTFMEMGKDIYIQVDPEKLGLTVEAMASWVE